jgi:hypothetical protein
MYHIFTRNPYSNLENYYLIQFDKYRNNIIITFKCVEICLKGTVTEEIPHY